MSKNVKYPEPDNKLYSLGYKYPYIALSIAIVHQAVIEGLQGVIEAVEWLVYDPWAEIMISYLNFNNGSLIRWAEKTYKDLYIANPSWGWECT